MQNKQDIEATVNAEMTQKSNPDGNKKGNNVGAMVVNIISWVVTVIAVLMMIFTIISSLTFNRNDRNFLGFKFYIVQSDSMSATDFNAGDLIASKKVDPTTLKEGDIISFQSQNTESYGETITHKIRSATIDNEGNPGFITYGTTTNTDDEAIVTYSFIMGKYAFKIPKLGYFFNFLKTVPGYIICILVPFLIIILIQGIKTVKLFRKYKSEQKKAIDKEREELNKQREENEKMMRELLEMKEQMMNSQQSAPRQEERSYSRPTTQPTARPPQRTAQRPSQKPTQRLSDAQRTTDTPRTTRRPQDATPMPARRPANTQRKPESTNNQE